MPQVMGSGQSVMVGIIDGITLGKLGRSMLGDMVGKSSQTPHRPIRGST
jgi:hypothetical protein